MYRSQTDETPPPPSPEPTPTEPTPSVAPTPTPSVSESPVTVCGTVDQPCHVAMSGDTLVFVGLVSLLVLLLLAAILGAQLRRS